MGNHQEKVLDIGGCESILPMYLAKKNFQVTVFDFRNYLERHRNIVSIRGDFLENKLPGQSFDWIVLISTIEHIGFGAYGAPQCEDGDMLAMKEVRRIVKPSGKIVISFPFVGAHRIIPGYERWYDKQRVQKLFEGLKVLNEEYYIPVSKLFGRWLNFAPASIDDMAAAGEKIPCQGCACYVLSPSMQDRAAKFKTT